MDDNSPITVTEAVDMLRTLGYTAEFELVDGLLRSDGGSSPCAVDEAIVERLYRFEGPSDPGDEMIVFRTTRSRVRNTRHARGRIRARR